MTQDISLNYLVLSKCILYRYITLKANNLMSITLKQNKQFKSNSITSIYILFLLYNMILENM